MRGGGSSATSATIVRRSGKPREFAGRGRGGKGAHRSITAGTHHRSHDRPLAQEGADAGFHQSVEFFGQTSKLAIYSPESQIGSKGDASYDGTRAGR
jgi:hypothetical protein